jgi:uncharacterized protein (DUF58 family)
MFVVDCSGSVDYGPSGITKKAIQYLMMEILAPAVARNNNKVGFVLATDRIEKVLEPRFGETEVFGRLDFISGFKPKNKGTNLSVVFKEIISCFLDADLMFVISDFYSPGDFSDSLKLLSKRYDVIPVVLKDPAETTTFPSVRGAMVAFKDKETGEFFWGDAPNKISNVRMFQKLGLDYVLLKTNETVDDWVKKFVVIFEERKKWRKS